MPTPKRDESEDAYIARCMGDAHMQSQFPEERQRAAVCHAYWGNYQSHGSIKSSEKEESK